MADQDFKPGDIPDITTALPQLLPAIRRKTMEGWALIALTVAVAAIIILIAQDLGNKPFQLQLIVAAIAVALIVGVARRTRRGHEAVIMPVLAQTAGLSYSQQASSFVAALPPRLLPKASVRNSEDLLTGKLGERTIRIAELHYETGGKNSSTLFRGIVAAFPNGAPMPPFFLADEKATRGWFVFKGNIQVDDLVRIRSLMGNGGVAYGVWGSSTAVAEHPALDAVLKILTNLQNSIGPTARLYTASSNGEIMHVALSHKRDLFKIGGLLAGRDRLIEDIRLGYQDLTVPLIIASRLLDAEKTALPA